MPEQSAKEKIKEFLSSIITEHNSQLAATYLTKTQAAQIVADSSSEKLTPNLVLGEWTKDGTTYTAPVTYGGDGTLSASGGTIANGTLTVTDDDGTFSGAVIASEGNNFAPTKLVFSRSVETVGGSGKRVPTLSVTVGSFEGENTITYDGDGTLKAFQDDGTEYKIINNQFYAHSNYEVEEHGYLLASETDNCAPVWTKFTVYGGIH